MGLSMSNNDNFIPDNVCEYCKECFYFYHEFWNCEGETEPCIDFFPKLGSKYKKVDIQITKEKE